MAAPPHARTVARLIVGCLENEGVEYVFGLPGEENLHMIDALADSPIRFVTTRDERGAAFMADTYGAITGRAGVCLATLGPGAINLMLGIANAQLDSHPLVAITAQGGLDRIYKESHQFVDIVGLYHPITKWGGMLTVPGAAPEMVRKAFKQAETERPGATFLVVPEDIAERETSGAPLPVNVPRDPAPADEQVLRAVEVLESAQHPVVLAGPGVARDRAGAALVRFAEQLNLPVATTFLGKGVFPDDHPNALGTIGFMVKDYANFGFDRADVVVAVGYDLVEYSPARWNPNRDKRIVHVHRTVAEVDANYALAVGLQGNIGEALDAIAAASDVHVVRGWSPPVRGLVREELDRGAADDSFPVRPPRIVADVRAAMGEEDIVLCDTGAVKMWMARLYPTYRPNTCLISNGLATMAFSLPGAFAAKLVHPERKVLAAMGDGAFLMSVAELETAVRERVPFVVLVWVDGGYGLIGWKQDIHFSRRSAVSFGNPDFVRLAESFGARGYAIGAADELLPTLRKALDDDVVSVIAVPVDYTANAELIERLGALTGVDLRGSPWGRVRGSGTGIGSSGRNTRRLVVAQGAIQLSFPPLLVIGAVAASEMTGNDGATGLLWAVYFCSAAVGALAIGRWMDRVGRRPGLLLAYAFSAAAGVGSAAAIVTDSFPLLIACAVPFGLASGGANLGRAAVADMHPAADRGRAIGWLLAIGTIGAVGGPLLVALLQDVAEARGLDPWVLPWVVVPVGAAAAIVAVAGVRPDPRDLAVVEAEAEATAGGRRPRDLLRVPAFRVAVLAAAVGQVVMVGIMGVTPSALHALHHGGTVISIVISVHVAGMFAFAPLIGRWMDRSGHRSGLVWGCVVSLAGALITATEASSWVIGLGLFAIGIGWSATFLGATAVISDATQPDERAGALGFTDLLVSLCSAIAGLAGGIVLQAFGFGPLGIGLAVVVSAVLLVVLRMRDPAVPTRVASGA